MKSRFVRQRVFAAFLCSALGALEGCDLQPEDFLQPGDVWIDGFEVTQGIQTSDNAVPLIAEKRTFIRVYVRSKEDAKGALHDIHAAMTVDGESKPYAPINQSAITASPNGSNHTRLDDSFVFELDSTVITAGARDVHVTLIPPADRPQSGIWPLSLPLPLSFGPMGAPVELHVLGARYGYSNVPEVIQREAGLTSSYWQPRPHSDFELLRVAAENALPLAHLYIDHDPTLAPPIIDCKATQNPDTGQWGCAGYLDGQEAAKNIIDAKCPQGGCWIVMLQPETNCGCGTYGQTRLGNHWINMQGETNPDIMGTTLAHEIGHGLGLPHTFDSGSGYPRADGGLGPFVALRYSPVLSLIPGQNASSATVGYDTMSYNIPSWFSPFHYCKALAISSNQRLACPSGTDGIP